jgi:hypothetical protein
MNPPVAAAVFAVDEKPQIQALNRTAPILPMLPTTPQRATHDYERNGTCDLFAALEVATGTVITDIRASHTSADFIAFLNKGQPPGPQGPRCVKRVGPHTLRHAFITAALDAGVPLRDVQEAASHADPRTTMRYDRARVSLDRHATYIVATFLAGASR